MRQAARGLEMLGRKLLLAVIRYGDVMDVNTGSQWQPVDPASGRARCARSFTFRQPLAAGTWRRRIFICCWRRSRR